MTAAVILWSHALAALLFGALALAQFRRPDGHWPHMAFMIALVTTSLWALGVAGIETGDVVTRVAASARDVAWLIFMLALVRRDRA